MLHVDPWQVDSHCWPFSAKARAIRCQGHFSHGTWKLHGQEFYCLRLGPAGRSSHLDLLALQLPFLEAGLFFTFRAASFEGAETLTAAGLGTARPLPLPMSTAAIGKLIWTMAEKGGGGAHDQLKKCRKQTSSERKSYYINAARANLSTSHGTLRLVECFV